jgi:hypothetical protein
LVQRRIFELGMADAFTDTNTGIVNTATNTEFIFRGCEEADTLSAESLDGLDLCRRWSTVNQWWALGSRGLKGGVFGRSSKHLARFNKPRTRAEATKKRETRSWGSGSISMSFGNVSELSTLVRPRDKISKEDHAKWLAVVELSLFLTRTWANFLFPDNNLPQARELMLVLKVIFIANLKGKPLTETGVSRVTGMPRATLARRIDLLIKEGWVVRSRNVYYFDFDKFRERNLSSHLCSLSDAITMAARQLPDPG